MRESSARKNRRRAALSRLRNPSARDRLQDLDAEVQVLRTVAMRDIRLWLVTLHLLYRTPVAEFPEPLQAKLKEQVRQKAGLGSAAFGLRVSKPGARSLGEERFREDKRPAQDLAVKLEAQLSWPLALWSVSPGELRDALEACQLEERGVRPSPALEYAVKILDTGLLGPAGAPVPGRSVLGVAGLGGPLNRLAREAAYRGFGGPRSAFHGELLRALFADWDLSGRDRALTDKFTHFGVSGPLWDYFTANPDTWLSLKPAEGRPGLLKLRAGLVASEQQARESRKIAGHLAVKRAQLDQDQAEGRAALEAKRSWLERELEALETQEVQLDRDYDECRESLEAEAERGKRAALARFRAAAPQPGAPAEGPAGGPAGGEDEE